MPTKEEINSFLADVKSAIDSKNFQILRERGNYIKTRLALEIDDEDVLYDIYHLTDKDAWEAPELDKGINKNPKYGDDLVWQCKKFLHNKYIYIKLKTIVKENKKLLILSYHIDGME